MGHAAQRVAVTVVVAHVAQVGEDVVVVVVLQVVAQKVVADADPAESRKERRQHQDLSRISDRIGQRAENNPHVCCG